jgi:branched-chain amino acid transport system substrate-binding protein
MALATRLRQHLSKSLVTAATISCLALAACAPSSNSSSGGDGGDTYKIGVLVGLTGAYSTLGEPEQKAVQAFADQVNDDGGINGHQIELVFADTRSEESSAVNAFRELVDKDNVVAVVGPSSSGESVAVRQLADQQGIPTISMASAGAITDGSTATFKSFYAPSFSVRAMLFAAAKKGAKTVSVLTPNSEYGDEAIDAAEEYAGDYGLQYQGVERFDPAATDITPQLSKLRSASVDAIIAFAVLPQNAIIARNAEDIGLDAMLIQGPGGASETYLTDAGSAAEGTFVQGSKSLVPDKVPASDPQKDTLMAFDKAYRAATGGPGNQFAGNGWDAMTLLAAALKTEDIDPADVEKARAAILDSLESNIKDVPGLNARYTFTPEDHASENLDGLSVLVVRDGAYELYAGDIPESYR